MSEEPLRHAAARLHQLAIMVDVVGSAALAEADQGWRSDAATAFAQRMAQSASAVRECAARLDDAAAAVRQHADHCAAVLAGAGEGQG